MSALPLLSEIAGTGVRIRADGRHLAVSPEKLTDSLATRIRENKPALIADLEKLRLAGSDWQEIVAHPEQLRAFIYSFVTTQARERGEIPAHYTATVHCQNCNQDVPHFPVGDDTVGACVWCLNGQKVPSRQAT